MDVRRCPTCERALYPDERVFCDSCTRTIHLDVAVKEAVRLSGKVAELELRDDARGGDE